MSWLKIYVKTILFGLPFLVALGLSTWAIGEKATGLVFFAFIAALSIWSARFGQLHRIFPGLQLIDALAFLLVVAFMFALIASEGGVAWFFAAAIGLIVYGLFCMLRVGIWRRGSSVSLKGTALEIFDVWDPTTTTRAKRTEDPRSPEQR